MVIALLLSSLLFGLAGAALAAFAGLGLILCIASYIAGGMIGTLGVILFAMRHQAPAIEAQQSPNAPQPSG